MPPRVRNINSNEIEYDGERYVLVDSETVPPNHTNTHRLSGEGVIVRVTHDGTGNVLFETFSPAGLRTAVIEEGERKCVNCLYAERNSGVAPCRFCAGHDEWMPMRRTSTPNMPSEVEKDCATCRHEAKTASARPCNDCTSAWSRWVPKSKRKRSKRAKEKKEKPAETSTPPNITRRIIMRKREDAP